MNSDAEVEPAAERSDSDASDRDAMLLQDAGRSDVGCAGRHSNCKVAAEMPRAKRAAPPILNLTGVIET
jgi:hypothetical protein